MVITQVGSKLFRGPRPDLTSTYDLSQLENREIKTIINLEVGFFELFHGLSGQEKSRCEKLDITYAQEKMSDLTAPTPKQLDMVLAWINNARNAGGVFVHCLHGEDRTGIVCAAYEVKVLGRPIEDAIHNELREYLGKQAQPLQVSG